MDNTGFSKDQSRERSRGPARHIYAAVGFFAFATFAGYMLGGRTWHGVVYLSDGVLINNTRGPAAIKRELDFSRLDGAELISATQKRLVTAARSIVREGAIGIELGHFVARDENGERRLACDSLYNRLSLHFTGEGIASAGEKPEMIIDAPCAVSAKDITSIAPIWIPVGELLKGAAESSEKNFDGGIGVKFFHLAGNWPMSWSLQSVRLYNTVEAGREVAISEREMREIRKKPFTMNWLEARSLPASPPEHLGSPAPFAPTQEP